jgi:hypothetical protein
MNKLIAAAVAAITCALVVSAAVASTKSATVKATGENYLITGKAPQVGSARVAAVKVLSNGHEVAHEKRYQAPSAADHYAFWVLTKQTELPAGNYVVDIVKVANGKKSNLKFAFTIS